MPEYRLTDGERSALLLAAMAILSAHSPTADLLNAIAKISGVDTVLTASRCYAPALVMSDDN
jgi:hypothetical protein